MLQTQGLPYATVWKIEGLDAGVNLVHTSAECGSGPRAGSSGGISGDAGLWPLAKPGRRGWIEDAGKRARDDEP